MVEGYKGSFPIGSGSGPCVTCYWLSAPGRGYIVVTSVSGDIAWDRRCWGRCSGAEPRAYWPGDQRRSEDQRFLSLWQQGDGRAAKRRERRPKLEVSPLRSPDTDPRTLRRRFCSGADASRRNQKFQNLCPTRWWIPLRAKCGSSSPS